MRALPVLRLALRRRQGYVGHVGARRLAFRGDKVAARIK
jgi:hypothetical protein